MTCIPVISKIMAVGKKEVKTHYSTGCKGIDNLLHGGIEAGTLTQIYGAPGTGKTSLCLQTAITNAKTSILYIDTDNCSEERYMQILGTSNPIPISYARPGTLQEQTAIINKLDNQQKRTRINLVIVDTISLHYRLALNDHPNPKGELGMQLLPLLEVARKYNTAVVVTNQIYKDLATNKLRPSGGKMLEHLSKVILELKKPTDKPPGKRIAILKRYHSKYPNTELTFSLTKKGIE